METLQWELLRIINILSALANLLQQLTFASYGTDSGFTNTCGEQRCPRVCEGLSELALLKSAQMYQGPPQPQSQGKCKAFLWVLSRNVDSV